MITLSWKLFVVLLLATSSAENVDARFKMFMHVGHGGGSFMCKLAQLNGEAVYKARNCNLPGDGAGKDYVVSNCEQREAALRLVKYQHGKTFGGCEHGFKDDEFCPHLYRYIFYLRNPLDILNSWLSARVNNTDAAEKVLHVMASDPGTTSFYIKNIYRQPKHSLYRLDNFVTRYLSGSNATYFGPLRSINATHLQHAIEVLQQFVVVFSDEDMKLRPEKVEKMLAMKLNWEKPLNALSRNVNSHGTHKLNSSQIEFLRSYNKYDMMLYEHVKSMFVQAEY